MTNRILLLAVASVFAGAVRGGAAGADGPNARPEVREKQKRLEGVWRVVAAGQAGEAVESKTVVRFAGNTCTLSEPGSGLPDLGLSPSREKVGSPAPARWRIPACPRDRVYNRL
ncbi:MAG TPA: hypothetical protein VH092_32025 [Urbifossiella sp.]|jgi:hypothetical protein|nr:hypothetical protein [Urbifossiella sp.]